MNILSIMLFDHVIRSCYSIMLFDHVVLSIDDRQYGLNHIKAPGVGLEPTSPEGHQLARH